MMWWTLLTVVHAGQWLPQKPLDLEADVPVLFEQIAGHGLLLRTDSSEAQITAKADGLTLVLKAGPNGSLLLPPAFRNRQVEVQTDVPTRLNRWNETAKGNAAAWDRYESALARWMRKGGEMPDAPAPVAALEVDWEARREAFLARDGKVSSGLLMGFASLELEAHRARSKADHSLLELPSGRLADGKEWALALEGPGVLHLSIRSEMQGQLHRRFRLDAMSDGEVIHRSTLSSVENPEFPGLGNLRQVDIVIPHGPRVLHLRPEGADLRIEAELHGLRTPIRSVFGRWARSRRPSENPLVAMEQAHLSWNSPGAVTHARTLLASGIEKSSPIALLASARLIQHLPDAAKALEIWEDGPQLPVGGTALLRRWQLKGDVPLDVLVKAAELLPADPRWLAAIADALPAGFIRPRGQAIRELAGLPWGSDSHSRWTALDPEVAMSTLHLAGSRGGIGRVLIRAGQSAEVQLPSLSHGRFPLLRLFTQVRTEYTVNDDLRRGKGELFEALAPGIHRVEVSEGALLLLDGALAIGGQFMRERPLSAVPGRFALPDTGAPLEIEVLVSGGAGSVIGRTNTGESWKLDATEGLNRYALHLGAWASEITFEGDAHLRVSVAMRRTLEIDEPFASPEVLRNPLKSLHSSSQAMHGIAEAKDRVGLRLLRAAALEALGLLRSAREEARAAVEVEGATPRQRRIAEVILREAQPLALSAEVEGPVTVDAAAAVFRMDAPEDRQGLEELAEILGPPENAMVHLELARAYLAEGEVAKAWIHAEASGPLGRVDRLRIASAGHWEHITRVDQGDGSQTHGIGRMAAGLGASPLRLAREALVGAPWPAQDHLLLHDDKAAEIELAGKGPVQVKLVCADWGHQAEAPPCVFPISLNGQVQSIEIPGDSEGEVALTLQDDKGLLKVGPLSGSDQALAVWVGHNGVHQAPQSRLVRHRVGDGIRLRVRGESLIRLRVHGAAPVHLSSDKQKRRIQGEGILALPDPGWQTLRISGPPGVHVSLSRLSPQPKAPLTAPNPLRSSLDGTADSAATKAAAHWMSEVALRPGVGPFPVGRTGTFSLGAIGGLDQSGQRDHRLDYVYGGTRLAWNQRLGPKPDWLAFTAQLRGGTSGHPGFWSEMEWVHVAPNWATEIRLDGGVSGGASHIRGEGRARGIFALSPQWVLQPWLAGSWGRWSEGVGDPVDPLLWSGYNADHFWGLTAGAMGDWRPLRDARIRFASHVRSHPNFGLNWAEAFLRTDFMIGHNTVLTLLPAIGHRFEGTFRKEAYWRPRVKGRISVSGYASRSLRVELIGDIQWLPLQSGLEGGAQLRFQASPSRGLRDFSPLSMPFTAALDSRVEH
jgi:hypothetical protein